MYGKLFESMFDGTLANNWEALVVFQQMVILCDADGRVDMTPMALHRRTGIPLEIINREASHFSILELAPGGGLIESFNNTNI